MAALAAERSWRKEDKHQNAKILNSENTARPLPGMHVFAGMSVKLIKPP